MPLLQVSQLSKRFGRRTVVSGVEILVEPGEIVGLLGANGAGKTTTFQMVVGLLKPDTGTVHFLERDVTKWPMYRRARAGMGYLAQEPTIFADLSVADNIMMMVEQHYPRRERASRLDGLLDELSLRHLKQSLAGSLSGGERRRLEITRALVVEPKLLFFDEPYVGIDPLNRGEIRDLIRQMKGRGLSVLITDHNEVEILRLVDRLYVMEAGSILAEGTPDAIVKNPEVRRAYLGQDYGQESSVGDAS